MITQCRSCKGRLDEVLQKKDLVFVLCRECGLFQLKQESPNEFDINTSLQELGSVSTDDLTLEGLYLPSIIKHKRTDLLTQDTPVYFTLLSLQKALIRNGFEMIDADIQEMTFRVVFKPVDRLKWLRMRESGMKLRNKNTYLLFSLNFRNDQTKS